MYEGEPKNRQQAYNQNFVKQEKLKFFCLKNVSRGMQLKRIIDGGVRDSSPPVGDFYDFSKSKAILTPFG